MAVAVMHLGTMAHTRTRLRTVCEPIWRRHHPECCEEEEVVHYHDVPCVASSTRCSVVMSLKRYSCM
jgi:hypothetical protein